jgi:ornithine cyclodeaminase/alanine dehydrogenase-like protein (mu-crystallin family)
LRDNLRRVPELLYLSQKDVADVALPLSEVIELVAFALSEKAHGRVEMPPKPGVHPLAGALLHAMPAWVERAGTCGIKWVSAFPGNKARGLPSINGLIIVNDPTTGLAQAVLDATWITTVRTAASSAVAARALARPDSNVMAVLGAGVQGRANVAALQQVLPRLQLIRVYAPRRETLERYKQDVEREYNISVKAVMSAQEAVRDADVIITAAPWPMVTGVAPIKSEWLSKDVFACALDFDASFTAEAVASFDQRFTDDPATMIYYRNAGFFAAWPTDVQELAAVVAGLKPDRQERLSSKPERILTVNLGLGIYDLVVARRVIERAREQGRGTRLSL